MTLNDINEFTVDKTGLKKMMNKMHWKVILSFKTSWGAKWISIQSLWIMRSYDKDIRR